MKPKTLTQEQATEVALALLGIEPNLNSYDSKDYEHDIDFVKIEPIVGDTQLGIMIDFRITSKRLWAQQKPPAVSYQLYIGYYETIRGFNPAIHCA